MKNLHKFFLLGLILLAINLSAPKNSYSIEFTINATLQGLQEVPSNSSTATGSLTGTYDDVTNTLSFDVSFSGLAANATTSHFHGPAARGVNAGVQIGLTGFPAATSGNYSNSFVLTAAQELDILAGLWYINIHNGTFPGGEIRAQLDEGTLPVELSSFTASVIRDNVTLNWSTATESNNAGFDIERKLSSSSDWSKIGYVAGNGTVNDVKHYSFTNKVSTGSYSYRLKQIDFNGNFEYFNLSNDVNVGIPSEFNISQNYPNPFNPTTKIDFELPNDANVNITLYNLAGKEVLKVVNESRIAGYHTVQINASALSSGVYFYNITAGDFVQTKKMTVLK